MRVTRVIPVVLCAVLAASATAASAPRAPVVAPGAWGDLVSTTVLARLSRQEAAAATAGSPFDPPPARHGVDLYRITYRTPGVDGAATTASALVVLPDSGERTLRTVTWLHGTRVSRDDTASVADNLDRTVAVQFATAGYATVAPDYLGLGTGTGTHPYMLSAPTASAALDALRAARALAARDGVRLDRRVLVSGFSQGGQTAMVVGRALQESADFALGAVAGIAGPHDIRGHELPAALDGRLHGSRAVIYLAYANVVWQRVYGTLYDTWSDAYRSPYDRVVPTLFDGDHDEGDVAAALPSTPAELFTDEFLAVLTHPSGGLADVLAENDDPCAWRPAAPVRLYAGTGDRDVWFGNSVSCRDQLVARGATDSELVLLGDADHFGTWVRAMPAVLALFAAQG